MFSGIVDHCGEIVEIQDLLNSLRLWVQCEFVQLVVGESIAVDGVCLTVTAVENDRFSCDLSMETLGLTIAGDYKLGQKVNLERSLKLGDHLGGHWVTGHVDQTAKVFSVTSQQDSARHEFKEIAISGLSQSSMLYFVTKGSVSINGVSLTVNKVLLDGFSIMLIPHTLAMTNLLYLSEGDTVNLEYDYLAKLIQRQADLHFQAKASVDIEGIS